MSNINEGEKAQKKKREIMSDQRTGAQVDAPIFGGTPNVNQGQENRHGLTGEGFLQGADSRAWERRGNDSWEPGDTGTRGARKLIFSPRVPRGGEKATECEVQA